MAWRKSVSDYDPRKFGAQCDRCPLNGAQPVPPTPRTGGMVTEHTLVVIGEAPGRQEADLGRPFVGESGGRLEEGLTHGGLRRTEIHITNVVLCRPHNNDFAEVVRVTRAAQRAYKKATGEVAAYAAAEQRYAARLTKWAARVAKIQLRNAARAAEGKPLVPEPPQPPLPRVLRGPPPVYDHIEIPDLDPRTACRPRLLAELAQIKSPLFLAVGRTAYGALAAGPDLKYDAASDGWQTTNGGVSALPYDSHWAGAPVVSTIHPAAIMRAEGAAGIPPMYAFRRFVSKAAVYAHRGVPPDPFPTPDHWRHVRLGILQRIVDRAESAPLRLYADIESTSLAPDTRIRLIGVGCDIDGDWVSTYVLWHRTDGALFASDAAHRDLLSRLFINTTITVVFHNAGFDAQHIARYTPLTAKLGCTASAAWITSAPAPRNLAYVTALFTDHIRAWKDMGGKDHGASIPDARIRLLAEYCLRDVAATGAVDIPLQTIELPHAPELVALYNQCMEITAISAQMNVDGIPFRVNYRPVIRRKLRSTIVTGRRQAAAVLRERCREILEGGEAYYTAPEIEAAQYVVGRAQVAVDDDTYAVMVAQYTAGDDAVDLNAALPPVSIELEADRNPVLTVLGLHTILPTTSAAGSTLLSTAAAEVQSALNDIRAPGCAARFFGDRVKGTGWWGASAAAKRLSTFVELPLYRDGTRIVPGWNPLGAITGRFSAKTGMNTPKEIRVLMGYDPPPEGTPLDSEDYYAVAGADYAAIELRIAAYLAECTRLADALEGGQDLHRINAEAAAGGTTFPEFLQRILSNSRHPGCTHSMVLDIQDHVVIEGHPAWMPHARYIGACPQCREDFSGMLRAAEAELTKRRTWAKRLIYGMLYGSGAESLWLKLRVDDPQLPLGSIIEAKAGLERAYPELGRAVDARAAAYHQRLRTYGVGWLESPISGRRRYYTDHLPPSTEIANYAIQSGAGDVMNRALVAVRRAVDVFNGDDPDARRIVSYHGQRDPRKIVVASQVHDALYLLARLRYITDATGILKSEMPAPPGGYVIRTSFGNYVRKSFPVEAGWGYNFKEIA